MAKQYESPEKETLKSFNHIYDKTNLDNFIKVTVLVDNSQKEIYKVVKENDLHKYLGGFDVVIILNEELFDVLDEKQKEQVFDEALCGISYNDERGVVKITQPDFTTFRGIIEKYGYDEVIRLQDSIKIATQQNDEKELEMNHITQ
jgi:hypothetical protein